MDRRERYQGDGPPKDAKSLNWMNVLIADEQSHLPIAHESIKQTLAFLVETESVDCDEISVHLIDDRKISLMHEFYFQDSSPTDCISFPLDAPGQRDDGICFLGEIFLSTETAKRYAKEHEIDPYEEALLYLVHAFLHLLGYNDIEQEER